MTLDPAAARALFPGLLDKTFLDAACVSLAPVPAVEAIHAFLRDAMLCPAPSATLHHIAMDRSRETAREQAARLIHASPDEIALVESTTAGLSAIVPALPLADGDNVLLCDLEFLQVAIPFDARRIEMRRVPHAGGMVTTADFAAACDSRTRAIAVSSVQWSSGLKMDLAGLSGLARERGLWLVVDAIQQLGASPLDASALGIDVIVCGGHKWLNAPFGCGFLYVHRSRHDQLEPLTRGYLTLTEPPGGWGAYFSTPSITPFREYRYLADARKFETGGTANYPGAIGLAASLKLIHHLGPASESHIRALSRSLIDGLRRRNARVLTPDDDALRAGIVTFRLSDDPGADAALAAHLADRRIYVSTRYSSNIGGTRVSTHFFNNQDEVGQLLEAVDDFQTASLS
jgi:selenocysteine lyase/cysteine desulfurase